MKAYLLKGNSRIFVALFMILLTVCPACSSSRRALAVEEGWELIGESKVNFVRDKDEITVTSANQFTALRFRVEDREIRLNNLTVYYRNGDKLQPNVDEVIAADRDSREIELSPDGRYINKIEFKYRTTGSILKGRANVLIFGKKYGGW